LYPTKQMALKFNRGPPPVEVTLARGFVISNPSVKIRRSTALKENNKYSQCIS
jgi:hypothetical protein